MTATAAMNVFALARIGDVRIGVPSAGVVQVVPRPAQLMTLPRRSPSIEGLLLHAGRLLPVVRIDAWVDMGPTAGRGEERILVLRDAGRLIGLLVDAVMGVRRIQATDRLRIHRGDDAAELFQSVAPGVLDEPALSLLEVDRLMALADVWCDEGGVEAPVDEAESSLPEAIVGAKETYASFRIGDALAAIRAADIGELIPRPPLQHGLPLQSEARGILSWRGRFVPVVDLTRAIGARPDVTSAPWVCMVKRGEHAVGVLVQEVHALLAVDPAQLSVPFGAAAAGPDAALIRGDIVSEATRTVRLLDSDGLMQLYPEVAISARQADDIDADGPGHSRCTPSAFMVFDAGTPFASPIQSVQEVIDLPPALLARMEAGVPVSVEWRGHVVPLIDLRQRTDTNDTITLRQLVIIADGQQRAAVAIGGVRTLVPAKAATRRRFPAGTRGLVDMVTVDTLNHQASYAVLDLKQFVDQATT